MVVLADRRICEDAIDGARLATAADLADVIALLDRS
jgi:hypothetical protein